MTHRQLVRSRLSFVLLFLTILVCFSVLGFNPVAAVAQEVVFDRSKATVESITSTPHFTVNRWTMEGIPPVDETILNGPPTPPVGFEAQRSAVDLDKVTASTVVLTTPAFNWVFGCSSVSAAMIAGYYDRNGWPNIYTGPTNGGVMPLDNSSWSTWSDGYETYPNLPLAASHQGVDGRTSRGSIDDYWVQYGSSASDPYITGGWAQHTWSDAIGDYMKTSQSAFGRVDGATGFFTWSLFASKLTCDQMVSREFAGDGSYGRKLFYEARGYAVTDCYNQQTDNKVSGGFSFSQYKAEIDAGRPVMINLEGHTIVGVGYDSASNTVYLHDTWDYEIHSMAWGGSYSGMGMRAVSIVNISGTPTPPPPPTPTPVPWLTLLLSANG